MLYFEGCPNHEPTVALVREVVAGLDLSAEVEEIEVNTQTDAERLRFLGSPTVQVNGVDMEPRARERTNYALSCRALVQFANRRRARVYLEALLRRPVLPPRSVAYGIEGDRGPRGRIGLS